jgi:hypothetical protein
MKAVYSLVLLLLPLAGTAQQVTFIAADSTFEKATREYREIWAADGEHIVATLKTLSGMTLPDAALVAYIKEAPSYSGWKEKPMVLRASYSREIKKGALIHELGHRFHESLQTLPANSNEHELLFLYLYDAFVMLGGKDFADRMVSAERTRSNPANNYSAMWDAALSLTKEQRQEKLRLILENHQN